jgi:predicted Zn-dependent protease
MRIARVATLSLALIACAWFVLGIRQAHEIAGATQIVSQQSSPSAGQARKAASLLSSAGTLDPDIEVDVLRGRLAFVRGQLAAARRVLESVVRREPENLEAWSWLAKASAGAPATFRLAVAAVDRLLPKVPPPP